MLPNLSTLSPSGLRQGRSATTLQKETEAQKRFTIHNHIGHLTQSLTPFLCPEFTHPMPITAMLFNQPVLSAAWGTRKPRNLLMVKRDPFQFYSISQIRKLRFDFLGGMTCNVKRISKQKALGLMLFTLEAR